MLYLLIQMLKFKFVLFSNFFNSLRGLLSKTDISSIDNKTHTCNFLTIYMVIQGLFYSHLCREIAVHQYLLKSI